MSSILQTLSANDRAEHFNNRPLDQVLNQITDPNWTDPNRQLRTVGSDAMDKDAFLKMLLAQLQNQDPTNPLQSHEMAAQLAQFTSLEKLANIDEGINKLAQAHQPDTNMGSLNLIGKAVAGDSSQIFRAEQGESHLIRYDLAAPAVSTELRILNSDGQVVRSMVLTQQGEGRNHATWNGILDDGSIARPGDYRVEIEAKASNGSRVHASTRFEGVITGVNFTPQGPVMMVGSQQVRMADIKSIVDPKLVKGEEVEKLLQREIPGSEDKERGSELSGVGVSRELMNELNEQGVKVGI